MLKRLSSFRSGILTLIFFLASMITLTGCNAVFAANEDLEIPYSGGQKLDDVAVIDAGKTSRMNMVTKLTSDTTTEYSSDWQAWTYPGFTEDWAHGKSLTFPVGDKTFNDTWFIMRNVGSVSGQEIDIRADILRSKNKNSHDMLIGKRFGHMNIDARSASNGSFTEPLFVEIKFTIYKAGTNETLSIPSLFFGLTDFDIKASFKSPDIDISPSNLFIEKKGLFESATDDGDAYYNNGSLYYSTKYNIPDHGGDHAGDANVYMSLGKQGKESFSVYYGFGLPAGVGIDLFQEVHTVEYESDENGSITGIQNEKVAPDFSPVGSSETPNTNYYTSHWTCDKDVTLKDGSVISAGSAMQESDIKEVVVNDNLKFTVHHAPYLKVTYQWRDDIPEEVASELPPSKNDVESGVSYDVDRTRKVGDRVEEAKDGQQGYWTFNGWDNYTNSTSDTNAINPADPGSITITSDTTISGTWTFHPLYKITTEVENGSIDPNIENIEAGTSEETINYSPNENYELESITVDGESVDVSTYKDSYTFNDINFDHHIKVVYKAIPRYNVTYEWQGEHPDKSVPEGQTGILRDSTYTVDNTTYEVGDRVEEAKDGQQGYWTFNGWDQTGEFTITSDVVIKGTWTFHPTYNITTSVEGGTITPNINKIDEGESKTISYAPNPGYQLKTITVDGNNVNITDDNKDKTPFNNINSDHNIKVVYELIPELKITKTVNPSIVNAGDTVGYTITLEQTVNGAEARNVKVEDTLPEEITLIQDSLNAPQGATNIQKAEHSYSFVIPTLSSVNNNKVSFTYKATVAKGTSKDSLINKVKATAENVPEETEDEAEVKSVIPDATVEKTVTKDEKEINDENQVEYGDTVEYIINVKQTTKDAILRNLKIEDKIPEGLELVEDSISTTTTDEGDNASKDIEAKYEDGALIATEAELKDTLTIKFKAKVTAKTGEVKNIAILTGEDIEEKQDEATFKVKTPTLFIEKQADKKSVYKGDEITYTIKAHAEHGIALNAVVTDKLPSEVSLDESSINSKADSYSYDKASHTLAFNFKELSTEQTMSFKVKVTADVKAKQDIKNIATIKADECEEAEADASVELLPPIIKSVAPTVPKTGSETTKDNFSLSAPIISSAVAIFLLIAGVSAYITKRIK